MRWNDISYKHPPIGRDRKQTNPAKNRKRSSAVRHTWVHPLWGRKVGFPPRSTMQSDLLWDQAPLLLQLRLFSSDCPDQDAEDGLGDDVCDRVTDLLISRCNCPFNPCALDDVDEGVSQP